MTENVMGVIISTYRNSGFLYKSNVIMYVYYF